MTNYLIKYRSRALLKGRTVHPRMKILALVADPTVAVLRELPTDRWLLTVSSPATPTASPATSGGSSTAVSPTGTTSTSAVHRGPSGTREGIGPRTVHRSRWPLEVGVHVAEAHVLRTHHPVALLLLIVHGRWSHHSRGDHRAALHPLVEASRDVGHRVHPDVRDQDLAIARSPTATASRDPGWSRDLLSHWGYVRRGHHLLRHLWHLTHRRLGSHGCHHGLLIVRERRGIVERGHGWWLRCQLWLWFRPWHRCEVLLAFLIAREIVQWYYLGIRHHVMPFLIGFSRGVWDPMIRKYIVIRNYRD